MPQSTQNCRRISSLYKEDWRENSTTHSAQTGQTDLTVINGSDANFRYLLLDSAKISSEGIVHSWNFCTWLRLNYSSLITNVKVVLFILLTFQVTNKFKTHKYAGCQRISLNFILALKNILHDVKQ